MVIEATGIAALLTLVAAVIAPARSDFGLHRFLGGLCVAVLVVHIFAVLVGAPPDFHWWSRVSVYADLSVAALAGLIVSGIRDRKDYRRWRSWHLYLTAATVVAAVLHVFFSHHLIRITAVAWVFAACGCVVIALFMYRWENPPSMPTVGRHRKQVRPVSRVPVRRPRRF